MLKMRIRFKSIACSSLVVVFGLLCAELALRGLSVITAVDEILSPPKQSLPLRDERLGQRPNPEHASHDEKGFRNKAVPDRAGIVAMGDSQTYGTGADPDQAWPQQLSSLTGIETYNMAWGGYSPVHSLLLWDEAMALHPDMVIAAFYSGNDLYDAFLRVYYGEQLPELKSNGGRNFDKESLEVKPVNLEDYVNIYFVDWGDSVKFFLGHSKILALLRTFKHFIEHRYSWIDDFLYWDTYRKNALHHPEKGRLYVYEGSRFKTIFTPKYWLSAMDIGTPQIKEGWLLCSRAIKEMSLRARQQGIQFLVLFIPTKEYVFEPVVLEDVSDPEAYYVKLLAAEKKMWRETKSFLDQEGIGYVDALPALRECLQKGKQPYRVAADGHPNAIGYHAIAQSVKRAIQQMGMLPDAVN